MCGKEITGDYMTVEIDGEDFQVCQPRTAPINRCGNVAKRKLLEVFEKSDKAEMMLKDLDRAD